MIGVFRALVAATCVVFGAPLASAADAPFALRASLDTSASHPRTIAIGDYLKQLQEASGGRIQTQLFHSAQLYRDRDVAKALREGNIEMAVPGTWVLSGFVADADVFLLPVLAGQPADVVHKISDGKVGEMIDDELAKKLDVRILGPWVDLGQNNIYSTKKPINDFSDLVGLKLRSAGGAGLTLRTKFYQAIPNTTAWPDVPLALSQGTFDALISSNESVASAKLWDSGVKYAFEDHSYFAMYVPMVSHTFFDKLPADLQKLMVDLWAKNIPVYRTNAAAAQVHGRQEDEEHGMKFVDPTPERLAELRQKMMPTQDEVAAQLKLTPAIVKETTADIQGGS